MRARIVGMLRCSDRYESRGNVRLLNNLAACGAVAMLCCLGNSSASAATTAKAKFGWQHHASSVRQRHTTLLTLDRAGRSACQLEVSKRGDRTETFNYSEGSAPIRFAITPSNRTRLGIWKLEAACVQLGQVAAKRSTLHLKVIGTHRGTAFLVGKHGPSYVVPVNYGQVTNPIKIPAGGRGGDPGDDYPWKNVKQDSGVDPWGEDYRECTSFVAWALHSRNLYNMPFHDDAYNWGLDAEHLGIPVNHTPTVGSVAWEPAIPGHPWGHVMWVSAVSGSTVTVEEYNEHLANPGTYDQRSFNVNSEPYQYIHFKDMSYAPPSVPTPAPPTTPPSGNTHPETTGSVASTWTNYSTASGTEGPSISSNQTVQVSCKISGFMVADGDNWWYQVASSPWNNSYYVSADAFYNNGGTSGSLRGTPFVDSNVPTCGGSSSGTTTTTPTTTTTTPPATTPPPPPPPTYAETVGSVAHTWTNYANAGGTQGASISSNQTVQISCKVTGFQVADGNTWWYRIASSPWNNVFYVSADAFYNNGATSGSLHGTPFVDPNVPNC
jgi:surface antigen